MLKSRLKRARVCASSPCALEIDVPPVSLPWTKLPFFFEPAALRADLQAIEAATWVPHFNQQDYAGQWSSVSLRSRTGRAEDIVPHGAAEDFRDTPLATLCPHLQAAVDIFEFQKKSVRLLRLHAGSRVREHRDVDLGLADGELRIHVPVATNDQVEFIVSNRKLILREGEAWFIDFSQPHRIYNRSSHDRIHLVIDGTLNDWARELLERSTLEIVTETFEPSGVASFRHFREMVFEDAQLQATLLEFDDREQLMQAVVSMGREHGCEFDLDVVESAFNQKRHEWMERLTCG